MSVAPAVSNSSHMPVREGKLQVLELPQRARDRSPRSLIPENSHSTIESCYRCHPEKRGPFLWEHAPVREDCRNCHKPHGSNNIRLLKIREPRLCQQCHNPNRTHPRPSRGTTDPTQDRRFLGRSCAYCHNNLHGSNHPSGFVFTR